jgi:hypothetical protein
MLRQVLNSLNTLAEDGSVEEVCLLYIFQPLIATIHSFFFISAQSIVICDNGGSVTTAETITMFINFFGGNHLFLPFDFKY